MDNISIITGMKEEDLQRNVEIMEHGLNKYVMRLNKYYMTSNH